MNQLALPINLEVKLQENDIAFAVNDLIERIPDKAFESFLRKAGRLAYHPRMMLIYSICFFRQENGSLA